MVSATILVADDETYILNVVSIKLQNAGFRVLTAEDGAEACALALTHRPDLIITDCQMPRLSGLELACRLQRDPLTRDIPILLLTAHGFDLPASACDGDRAALRSQSRACEGADTEVARTAGPLPHGRGSDRGAAGSNRVSANIRCILPKPFSPRQVLACVQGLLSETGAALRGAGCLR